LKRFKNRSEGANEMPKSMQLLRLASACVLSIMCGQAAAQAQASVPRSQTLILAARSTGPTFPGVGVANPYMATEQTSVAPHLAQEALFYYNTFNGQLIPWQATAAKYSDGFKTLRVSIRPRVTWSDGTLFSPEDVAFTLKLLRDNGNGKKDLKGAVAIAAAVKDAVVAGNDVVITFNQPSPRFLLDQLVVMFGQGLTMLPAHVFKNVSDPGSFAYYDTAKGWPLTTGAYSLTRWTTTEIVLDRNDNWWGKKSGFRDLPAPRRVVAVPFNNPDRGAQLIQAGEADTSRDLPVGVIRKLLEGNESITTFSGKRSPFGNIDWWPISLWFNNMSAPFDDARVRRAISHSINRNQVVDFAFEGASDVSKGPYPAFGTLMKYIDASDTIAQAEGAITFDLAKTGKIMSDAGYQKNAAGFWAKNGQAIKSEIHSIGTLAEIGTIVAEQLRKAGFDVTFVQAADSLPRIRDGRAQMMLWGHHSSIADPYATLASYTCAQARPIGTPIYPNFSRWCDQEFDKIVAKIGELPPEDHARIMPLFKQAMAIWYRQTPEAPIVQWHHTVPLSTKYWRNWPTAGNPYIQPAFWLGTGPLVLHNLKPAPTEGK
jgi:peptide/nickel transport system substrate-binding protein